jgi:ABC-type polysaccharide/polyol phosphate transport system ATPase subunit/ABC-type polysaccharide/polyol phosphate export permease
VSTLAQSPAVVTVEGLDKSFRLPHQKYSTLKERALHPFATRTYDTLRALDDVSLEVRSGEFFGIVGRNGSGKSTLLKCLAGIYAIDEGHVQLDGRVSPFIELGVGFNPDLTARDNVLVNAIMLGLTRKQARERFDEIIAFAELEDFVDLNLKNYSSGMSARLGFSVAIQVDADVLLVDEVLAVGDAWFQTKCFEQFDRMKREGRTILFVTHDMAAVERFCDRAMVLELGRVIDVGDPERITRKYVELNTRDTGDGALRAPDPGADRRVGRHPNRGPDAARTNDDVPTQQYRGPAALGHDLRRFVSLTVTLAATDFKLRFFGSALGYAWTLMRPVLLFGVLYLVFTEIVRFGEHVDHYAVYLLASIVLFSFFAESTSRGVTALVERENLIRKIPFPRMAIPLAVALNALFNLAMSSVAVLFFVLASGIEPRFDWLQVPLLLVLLAAFAVGMAMLLSALFVRHRDIKPIWEVALQLLFYATPVLYVITDVPDGFKPFEVANPIAVALTQMRHALIDPTAPTAAGYFGGWEHLLIPLAVVAAVFALGAWVFGRETPRIAESL